jgi:hypothetical protein
VMEAETALKPCQERPLEARSSFGRETPNAPSVGFADSSPASRWSILALRSSTAKRGRWIPPKVGDGGGVQSDVGGEEVTG